MRFIILFLFVLLSTVISNAQISVKPVVGLSYSYMDKRTDMSGYNTTQMPVHGASGGLVFEYAFHNKFFVKTELLYVPMGGFYKFQLKTATGNFFIPPGTGWTARVFNQQQYKFNYLQMPLIINYSFTKNIKTGLGPSIGYLLNAISTLDNDQPQNMWNGIDKLDYKLNLDASYSIRDFEIAARFSNSLQKISYKGSDPEFWNNNSKRLPLSKNHSIQVYLMYRFIKK